MSQSCLFPETIRLFQKKMRALLAIAILLCCGLIPIQAVRAAEVGPILEQAQQQLAMAVQQAEISLQPHQPGSGHTKEHMQQMLNVLEGQTGKDFSRNSENPGDGEGVMKYLELAQENFKAGLASADVRQALEQTIALVQEATQHAKRSLHGANVQETHAQAGLAAGLAAAALGRHDSHSPVTGGLSYVMKKIRIDGETTRRN